MSAPSNNQIPEQPASAGCGPVSGSVVKYYRVRKLFGIFYVVGHDRAGWWITEKKGYETKMHAAYNKVTSPDGDTARQFILGGWMLMLMSPQNAEGDGRAH